MRIPKILKRRVKLKGYVSILIIVLMISTLIPSYAIETAKDDVTGHWAEKTIKQWEEKELMKGYPDGTFRPNNHITKAEFITLINRIYGYYEKADENYTDVKEQDWYYDAVSIAKANQYMQWYQEKELKPNEKITRQEVCAIIASIQQLQATEGLTKVNSFNDKELVPQWSKPYLDAVINSGYMKGYPDNTIKAEGNITRAEVGTLLDRVVGELINKSGIYGTDDKQQIIEGNLTINTQDVTLKNIIITGSLILAAGIGQGDINLENVKVKGKTIVNGGGENSITFHNSELGELIVYKQDGKIRVVSTDSDIGRLVILSSLNLIKGEGSMGPIDILGQGSEVKLTGNYDEPIIMEVQAEIVITKDTKIKQLEVTEKAKGTTIDIDKDGEIENITFNGQTVETGKGKITKLTFNSDGVKVEQKSSRSSGGNSGGSGGNSQDKEAPRVTSYIPANNAVDVQKNTDLKITFNESIQRVSGKYIKIYEADNDTQIRTIGAIDSQVTVNNKTVTINLSDDLEVKTQYYVLIEKGAFTDKAATPNEYAGITDKTTWTFTIGEDKKAPIVTSYTPVNHAVDVSINTDLEITFDENVQGVSGKSIRIYQSNNDTQVRSIGAIDAQVTNNTVTIDLSYELEYETQYHVLIEQGAFLDKATTPNEYVGIADKTAWSFTTKKAPPTYNKAQAQEGDYEREIKFTVEINKNGNLHYAITDKQLSPLPSAGDIKNENISNALETGNQNLTASTELTTTIQGLLPDKEHYIYLVAEDTSGNLADVKELTATSKIEQGDGSESKPYKIWYIEDLANIGTRTDSWEMDDYYTLMRDLDFEDNNSYKNPSDTSFGDVNNNGSVKGIKTELTTEKGWCRKEFSGNFNGNSKTISGLYIDRTEENYIGLFAVNDGTITDLGVLSVDISGKGNVGGITGGNAGTITNCYSTGIITANDKAGGIVGENLETGTIINSYSTGGITAEEDAGGIAGYNLDGTITNSYSTGTITANNDAGGIAGENCGENDDAIIINCYSTGNITAYRYAGGIAGENYEGIITNCYSTGDITVDYEAAGGIAGENDDGTIENCCAYNNTIIGTIIGNSNVNRIVGKNTYILTNNYAKSDMTIQPKNSSGDIITDNDLNEVTDGIGGVDISNLTSQNTEPLASWDFVDTDGDPIIWEIKDGAERPTLQGVGNDDGML